MHVSQHVLGPNLHLVAPFEALEVGFCTEFCCTSFVFSSPGANFGSPGRKLGPPGQVWGFPGRHCGTGMFWGSRKRYFCEERTFWWGCRGIRPAQMNCLVPRTHMGRLLCPKSCFFFAIFVLFHIFRNIGKAPSPASVVAAYFPWWKLWSTVTQCLPVSVWRTHVEKDT